MFRKWHLLALVPAFALAVVACDEAPTRPEPFVPSISAGVNVNEWDEGTGAWFDPCTVEWYDYEWRSHFLLNFTKDANGLLHAQGHENFKLRGIGRDSGIKYEGHWTWHWMGNPVAGLGVVYNHKGTDHVVSQGPAPNSRVIAYNWHRVINANGEVTSFWWEPEEIICTSN